jgi:hypothetical protein
MGLTCETLNFENKIWPEYQISLLHQGLGISFHHSEPTGEECSVTSFSKEGDNHYTFNANFASKYRRVIKLLEAESIFNSSVISLKLRGVFWGVESNTSGLSNFITQPVLKLVNQLLKYDGFIYLSGLSNGLVMGLKLRL